MPDVYHYVDSADQGAIATGDGGRRHAGITSRGVLWCAQRLSSGSIGFYYSNDNGDNWSYAGAQNVGGQTHGGGFSFFIDQFDRMHLVYEKWLGPSSDGRTDRSVITYRLTRLTAAHTGFAGWSAEFALTNNDYWHSPDLVAHGTSDGDIRVHIGYVYNWAGDNRHIAVYQRLLIDFATDGIFTEQGSSFIQDISGSQVYPGKMSLDFRHMGDGKHPYRDSAGIERPDVFMSWSASNQLYFCRWLWVDDGGGLFHWSGFVALLESGVSNAPSASTSGNFGGLYEHHRWSRTLYDARDDRAIVIGWLTNYGAFTYQGLVLNEIDLSITFAVSIRARTDFGNWDISTSVPTMLSGSATIDAESNIVMYGSLQWQVWAGTAKILRPRGSDTRTWAEAGNIDNAFQNGANGPRAFMLPYPQGERHDFSVRNENGLIEWRHARSAKRVIVPGGTDWTRRAQFTLGPLGDWIPSMPRAT